MFPQISALCIALLFGNVTCDNGNGLMRIVQRDTVPPVITILQPAADAKLSAVHISVSGTYSDQSATTITVNGVAATVTGNTFAVSVPLRNGNNTLLVVALDGAGNRAESTRIVYSDVFAPDIVIEQPVDDVVIRTPQLVVTGTVEDDLPFMVTVNNVPATIASGRFTATITLSKGGNTITVRGVDAAGNRREETRGIEHYTDTTRPQLTVTSPAEGVITNHAVLVGRVADESPVWVELNGVGHLGVAHDGTFREEEFLPTRSGKNRLRLVAIDEARNRSREVVRTFVMDVIAPEISELAPTNKSSVNTGTIAISGRITDAHRVTVRISNLTTTVRSNGRFRIKGVPIVEGDNDLVIYTKDVAGNETKTRLRLIGKERQAAAAP